MNKKCTNCLRSKSLHLFYKNRSTKDGFDTRCIKCKQAYRIENKKAIKKHRKKYGRRDQLKHNYGISIADFEAMKLFQGNKCGICEVHGHNTLCIDHCHETGKIRGLLCRKCNAALGIFKDSETILQKAIEHLRGKNVYSQKST